jgi:hypothetical protein
MYISPKKQKGDMSKGVANTVGHQKNIQKINPRLLILICKVQKIFCLHPIKIQTMVQPTLKTGDICEIRRDLSYLDRSIRTHWSDKTRTGVEPVLCIVLSKI